MNVMKNLIYIIIICLFSYSCNTGKKAIEQTDEITTKEQDTVRIANEELEYEIIIIEPGFNTWVASTARPRGYYELSYLENRNKRRKHSFHSN